MYFLSSLSRFHGSIVIRFEIFLKYQNNDEKRVLVTVDFDARNLGLYDPVPEIEVTVDLIKLHMCLINRDIIKF